jgi:hypothetical protein
MSNGTSQRPLPTQHTTNTRDEHLCIEWGLNTQTYPLDRTVTGIGISETVLSKNVLTPMMAAGSETRFVGRWLRLGVTHDL